MARVCLLTETLASLMAGSPGSQRSKNTFKQMICQSCRESMVSLWLCSNLLSVEFGLKRPTMKIGGAFLLLRHLNPLSFIKMTYFGVNLVE